MAVVIIGAAIAAAATVISSVISGAVKAANARNLLYTQKELAFLQNQQFLKGYEGESQTRYVLIIAATVIIAGLVIITLIRTG